MLMLIDKEFAQPVMVLEDRMLLLFKHVKDAKDEV